MNIYYIIYVPFLLISFLDFKEEVSLSTKKKTLWFFVCVFTLFRGLRWETGTDWDQFYEVYNNSSWDNIFNYARDEWSDKVMDYGYMFINALFHESGFSYTFFLLFTTFIIQYSFFDFSVRNSKYPILTYVLLMNVGVPFPVRASLAHAIAIYSTRYINERKIVIFFFVAIIASLIHKGALFILPFYFVPILLNKYSIKWYHYTILYISTYFLASIAGNYVRELMMLVASTDESLLAYAEAYGNMDTTSIANIANGASGNLLNGVSYTIFFFLLLYIKETYSNECRDKIQCFDFFFFLYAFYAFIDNLIRLSDKTGVTEVLSRTTGTIDMFPIIFPILFTLLISKYIRDRRFVAFIFIAYMSYKFWLQIPGALFADLFIPYKCVII